MAKKKKVKSDLKTEENTNDKAPYLTEMIIDEFRGVRKCQQPIPLSKFTVLVGRNNSGKSSILEAIALLYRPFRNWNLPYCDSSIMDLITSFHQKKRSLVYAYSGEAKLSYKFKKDEILLSISDRGTVNDISVNKVKKAEDEYQTFFKQLFLENKSGSREWAPLFFIPNSTSFLDRLFNNIGREESREWLSKHDVNVDVVENIINKCVDENFTEMLPGSNEYRFRKDIGPKKVYPFLYDFGEGVKKSVLIYLALELYNPKIIVWDDFEGAAHPALLKTLLNWLNNRNSQVILSTHSMDVLRIIGDEDSLNTTILLTKKTHDDTLLTEQINNDELKEIFDSNVDPRCFVDRLGL